MARTKAVNVVLVHGGFVDGSGWRGVYEFLKKEGYEVSVVQNPTTSLDDDVAATKLILDTQDRAVILVGHSYGGVVITEAGNHPKVVGLVYVAAFAPSEGESVNSLIQNPPPGAPVPPILAPRDGRLFLDKDKFHAAFAADLDSDEAAFMADSQVPWGVDALRGTITKAAWRTKPSWYLVTTEDRMIPPPAQRIMAERARVGRPLARFDSAWGRAGGCLQDGQHRSRVTVWSSYPQHRGGIMNRGAFVGRTRLFGVLLLGALLGACGGGGGSTANDRQGPTLACTAPVDGATLNQPPGQITLNGSVSDPDGVSSLSVNGAPIAVAASGNFSAPLSTTWGINLVTLSATDGLGNQGRGTCAFLVADTWAPDNTFLDGAISFNVAQPALDDGNRSGAIDSLADVLHAGLNSSGLNSALTNFLLATNPLIDQCVVPGLFGTCTVYVRIRALSAAVGVPVSTSLQLIQSGLSVSVSAPNITIQFLVDGSVFGVPYSVPGTATFGNASVVAQLSGEVSNGQPVTHVNSISPNLGTVSITFGGSGVVSDVLNAVSSVFSALAPTLEQYFGSIVISWILPLLSNVSIIPALASTFDVTRLDGTGSISVSFGTNYSTLDFSASRMLAVLGTQFTVTPASAAQTMGAPIPDGVRPLDLGAAAPVGIAFHIGLLDQALYSLWRAGYYDDNFGGGGLGGVVGAGAGFEMTTALPPAAQLLGNGRVEIALGAVSGRLMDPTIAPTEVPLQLGARVSCVPSLAGDRLVLDGCTVDQLAWSNAGPALGAQAQSKVEQFITSLVTALATLGAEDALPVLPIPAVPLDSLLALVGLPPANPAGQILGIVSPTLSKLGDHVVLEGAFGSR